MRGSLEDMIFAFESKIDELENAKVESFNESFPGRYGIDLDKVALSVWDELQSDKLGEEDWIEFDYDDPRGYFNSTETSADFEAVGANRTMRGYLKTAKDKVIVHFNKGEELLCDSVDEIVDFIIETING